MKLKSAADPINSNNSMSTDSAELTDTTYQSNQSNVTDYRAVSKAAVASIVLGVIGISSFLAQIFLVLPVLGIIFGLLGILAVRKYPDELVGGAVAKIGLLISAVCLITSVSMHTFIYATELPDGYQRISFGDLKPSARRGKIFTRRSQELDGKKVFLKGYVRPPSGKKTGLKNFIMVGDFGDCCFGGDVAITDVVAVKIQTDDTVNYGYGLRRIGGTFKLNPNKIPGGEEDVPQVYYEINADHVR